MTDQTLYMSARLNNTFDQTALETTLNDIRTAAYQNLLNYQRNSGIIKRFDFKMSDFVLSQSVTKTVQIRPKKYIHFIKENFIELDKRSLYKNSSLYMKELSIFDIASNPTIFAFTYMVFINGKFYDTANIICDEDSTGIILDLQGTTGQNPTGIPDSHFEQLLAANANVTVIFTVNCAYGVYTTNISTLSANKDGLALSRFNLANNLDTDTRYITFINSNNLLFESVITDTTNSTSSLRFTNNSIYDFEHKLIHLNIFGLRNLLDMYDISAGTKFFSVPIQGMPIPVENMIVFKVVNGHKVFAHGITIKQYYPNYYEIIGNTDNSALSIFVFYTKGSFTTPSYTNEIALYQSVFNTTVSDYANGKIPSFILNYSPYLRDYSISNFQSTQTDFDHFKYKVQALNDFIANNAEYLRTYLYNQFDSSNSYYIDCSTIDLSAKLRNNNYSEITTTTDLKTFTEPRYVFILNKWGGGDDQLHYRFFVDGILYYPDEVYSDTKYEYYYIPARLITSTTKIEVEKFNSIRFESQVMFSSLSEYKTLKFTSDKPLLASDIFLIDAATREYISETQFDIYVPIDGTNTALAKGSHYVLPGQFSIKLTDETLLSRNINMIVEQTFYYQYKKIANEYDKGDVFVFNTLSQNDVAYIRLFKNGRMLLREHVYARFGDTLDDEKFVASLIAKQVGEEYVIDYTPFRYTEVYHQMELPENGFVDLRGLIDKPFDLKWYDVYVNGRKLNSNNVDIITPTIIFIKNVSSRKHFVILQKNRDEEFFKLGSNLSHSDVIWDTFPTLQTKLKTRTSILDTETDIVGELVDVQSLEIMHFFRVYMISLKTINPDLTQITDAVLAKYDYVLNGNSIFLINPDDGPDDFDVVMRINPDETLS